MRGFSLPLGGGVYSFPLTLGEYFDAHRVPAEARPRWIRLLAHMESVYKDCIAEAPPPKPRPKGKGDPDAQP